MNYWTDIYYTRAYAEQYLRFLRGCLLAPEIEVSFTGGYASLIQSEARGFSRVGFILLILALFGFLLNIKDKFSFLCLYWLTLSYFLLYPVSRGLAGYSDATAFSIPVSWAMFSLIFMGARKALSRLMFVRPVIISVAFFFLAATNLRALRELILFGLKYYPR